MKIIIRYYNQWGNMSTKPCNVQLDITIADLKKQIKHLTEIDVEEQILIINEIVLEDDKLLGYYDPEDSQFIYVNLKADITSDSLVDQDMQQEITNQTQFNQQKYFQKLGIIQEDGDDEDFEETKSKQSGTQRSQQDILQEFIKCIKNNDWLTAQQLIIERKSFQPKSNQSTTEDSNIINDRSYTGWNALHYACHMGLSNIAKELISNGADINLPTKDNYSALQLAIQKCQLECASILLSIATCDVNYVANEKSALQIAVLKGEFDLIEKIIHHPLFNKESVQLSSLTGDQQGINIVIEFLKPEKKKPMAQRGYCKKVNVMRFFHYKRYFVLDPDSGTLTRYNEDKDYPLKPIEVIALSSIKSVQFPQKKWFMKNDHHYLSIMYRRSSYEFLLICSTSLKTMNAWKKSLEESIEYYSDQEKQLSQFQSQGDFDEIAKQISDTILFQNQFQDIADSRCGTLQQEDLEDLQKVHTQIVAQQDFTIKPPQIQKKQSSPKEVPISPIKEKPLSTVAPHLAEYQVVKQIGQGAFGKVFLVQYLATKQMYAMKQLNKRKLIQKKQVKFAVTECNVLKQVDCPYVVNLFQSFQTPINLYLVMDYCGGGDLSYHLSKKRKFPESLCKNIIRQVMKAIQYLHSMNIIYRDLKPENIIIDNKRMIKLVDFGLSKQTELGSAKTFCGSPAYLAPEVLNNDGSMQASDVYGLGTVLYEMLTGDPPYFNEDVDQLFDNIRNENLKIPSFVSKPCSQLLIALLQKEPHKRIGCKTPSDVNWNLIKQNEWLEWNQADEEFPYHTKTEDMEQLVRDQTHNIGDKDYEEDNKNVNRIANWTFIRTIE